MFKWIFYRRCGQCYGEGYMVCNNGMYIKCPELYQRTCKKGWLPRFWK